MFLKKKSKFSLKNKTFVQNEPNSVKWRSLVLKQHWFKFGSLCNIISVCVYIWVQKTQIAIRVAFHNEGVKQEADDVGKDMPPDASTELNQNQMNWLVDNL